VRPDVIARDGKSVGEEGYTVLPIPGLPAGERGAEHDHCGRRGGHNQMPPAPAKGQFLRAPYQQHEHANQRHVREAVGHGLLARLDQPGKGHQHAQNQNHPTSR
jgi:hypothetical protein